jgi:hypothetical protein
MNSIELAERLIKIAEALIEKEALSEQMQSRLLGEIDRVKSVVIEEGITVEEAMDLVFGRGFRTAYPEWYEKIVKYVTDMLQALGSKKRSYIEKRAIVKKCKEEDKESAEDKWCVYSEKGKLLGRYLTKEQAEKRLRQVEYFKHKKS